LPEKFFSTFPIVSAYSLLGILKVAGCLEPLGYLLGAKLPLDLLPPLLRWFVSKMNPPSSEDEQDNDGAANDV
jgi:hypothetical protein